MATTTKAKGVHCPQCRAEVQPVKAPDGVSRIPEHGDCGGQGRTDY